MQRYPVLYGRSRKLRLRKKRIALFGLVLLLLLIIGVGVNTVSFFNRMTDRDPWATSLKKGAEEAARQNYLIMLLTGEDDSRELMSLCLISSHADSPFSLILPGNSSPEEGVVFSERYGSSGTQGVVDALKEVTGEPVHYYLAVDDAIFASLREIQDMRSRGPQAYYPIEPETGSGQLMMEVQNWEKDTLAFAQELTAGASFWRWPALIRETLHFYETNLTWREISSLMKAVEDYSLPESKQIQLAPGFWTSPEEGAHQTFVVDSLGLETLFEYMKVGRTILSRGEILVEVLNGSGVAGLARRTSLFLEEEGFTVVRVADADHFDYDHTQVISRRDDVTAAKEVAVIIQGAQLSREAAPESEAMVTVILGSDFDL